jgi:predicted SprT family Zn-dependent metalloprotease
VPEAASTTPYKPSNPRTPTQEKLLKDVKKANKQHRKTNTKPFHEYHYRGDSTRADIIRSFGVQIMAACSYSKLLNKSGIDYIEKDCEFKMDCSVLLEEIASFVGNKVKQNFSSTNFDNSLRYLPPGESLDAGTLVDRDRNYF